MMHRRPFERRHLDFSKVLEKNSIGYHAQQFVHRHLKY